MNGNEVQARWAPFGDGQGEDEAAEDARRWFTGAALPPTVITPGKGNRPNIDALARMIEAGEWSSARGNTATRFQPRGVVTWRPNWKDLEYATSLWRSGGGAIVVMEHPGWPIAGWAAAVGASTTRAPAERRTLTTSEDEALQDLLSVGYNGYHSDLARRTVPAILAEPALARMGRPWVMSALIGLGAHHRQMEELPAMPGVVTPILGRRGPDTTGRR